MHLPQFLDTDIFTFLRCLDLACQANSIHLVSGHESVVLYFLNCFSLKVLSTN